MKPTADRLKRKDRAYDSDEDEEGPLQRRGMHTNRMELDNAAKQMGGLSL